MDYAVGMDDNQVHKVCRIGQGAKCCSYLGANDKGIMCLKGSKYQQEIFQRRMAGEMKAMGDNCSGHPDYTPTLLIMDI